MAGYLLCDSLNLNVAGSNFRGSRIVFFLLIRGLFLIFIIALNRAAFCRVLASVRIEASFFRQV